MNPCRNFCYYQEDWQCTKEGYYDHCNAKASHEDIARLAAELKEATATLAKIKNALDEPGGLSSGTIVRLMRDALAPGWREK